MLSTSSDTTTELTAITPSTDRSMPPIMMMNETPNASMSKSEACLPRLARLRPLTKLGLTIQMAMKSTISISSGPTMAGMRIRRVFRSLLGVSVV